MHLDCTLVVTLMQQQFVNVHWGNKGELSCMQSNRGPRPEEISKALQQLPPVLKSMGVNVLCLPDVEADDVIATLATDFASRENLVSIFSADKVLYLTGSCTSHAVLTGV
jgi:5'-3' exonuclease